MALTIYYVLDAEPGIAVTPLTISSRLMELAQEAERAGLEAAASQMNTLAMNMFNLDHLQSVLA